MSGATSSLRQLRDRSMRTQPGLRNGKASCSHQASESPTQLTLLVVDFQGIASRTEPSYVDPARSGHGTQKPRDMSTRTLPEPAETLLDPAVKDAFPCCGEMRTRSDVERWTRGDPPLEGEP